jgi:hypothetical protein
MLEKEYVRDWYIAMSLTCNCLHLEHGYNLYYPTGHVHQIRVNCISNVYLNMRDHISTWQFIEQFFCKVRCNMMVTFCINSCCCLQINYNRFLQQRSPCSCFPIQNSTLWIETLLQIYLLEWIVLWLQICRRRPLQQQPTCKFVHN